MGLVSTDFARLVMVPCFVVLAGLAVGCKSPERDASDPVAMAGEFIRDREAEWKAQARIVAHDTERIRSFRIPFWEVPLPESLDDDAARDDESFEAWHAWVNRPVLRRDLAFHIATPGDLRMPDSEERFRYRFYEDRLELDQIYSTSLSVVPKRSHEFEARAEIGSFNELLRVLNYDESVETIRIPRPDGDRRLAERVNAYGVRTSHLDVRTDSRGRPERIEVIADDDFPLVYADRDTPRRCFEFREGELVAIKGYEEEWNSEAWELSFEARYEAGRLIELRYEDDYKVVKRYRERFEYGPKRLRKVTVEIEGPDGDFVKTLEWIWDGETRRGLVTRDEDHVALELRLGNRWLSTRELGARMGKHVAAGEWSKAEGVADAVARWALPHLTPDLAYDLVREAPCGDMGPDSFYRALAPVVLALDENGYDSHTILVGMEVRLRSGEIEEAEALLNRALSWQLDPDPRALVEAYQHRIRSFRAEQAP